MMTICQHLCSSLPKELFEKHLCKPLASWAFRPLEAHFCCCCCYALPLQAAGNFSLALPTQAHSNVFVSALHAFVCVA